MTLAEKVRQLDLYSGAQALVDKHKDDTHAAPDAVFMPEKAQALFGALGAGGIHDLYPQHQSRLMQSSSGSLRITDLGFQHSLLKKRYMSMTLELYSQRHRPCCDMGFRSR
jgi:hypothetical protein